MPLTPHERVRRQVCGVILPQLAELLYQADKGSPHAKLIDLRSEEARAVYVAEALMILSPEGRHERVTRVNQVQAETFAYADTDAEDAARQVRQDVARFRSRVPAAPPVVSHFGSVRPGYCHICRQPVLTDAAVLWLGDALKTDAHGLCCAMDPQERFELIADFSYRVKATGGAR
jgi:hypothetical protein